jgi:hypothetical protein
MMFFNFRIALELVAIHPTPPFRVAALAHPLLYFPAVRM